MDLSFQAADPAGNITLLVTTPVPPQDYQTIAARLLSLRELDAEQVGFLTPPRNGGAVRLEMMGGEFCGNALRCAALYCALNAGRRRESRFLAEISGCDEALSVQVNPLTGQVSAQMPLPQSVGPGTFLDAPARMVRLPGIVHAVSFLPPVRDAETVRPALATLAEEHGVPAAGVMFWDRQSSSLVPAVYVQGTDSLYYERSCASGSTAAAACHALSAQRDGHFQLTLRQPGGEIRTSAVLRGGRLTQISIGGLVTMGPAYTLQF